MKVKIEKSYNLLEGPLVPAIMMFAIPMILTSSLQQLFNAADIVVCGKFVGSIALAAVGANSQIVNLFVNSFLGLSVGTNVMIANYIGAGKKEKIHNVVQTSMTFAYIFGIALMIIGLMISRNILMFLGTPEEILVPATTYLRILFIGIPFVVVYNFGAAVLRSIGDTKRPLFILFLTGILNIVLNVIFVVKFKLGVTGVAIATAVSNAVSSIVVVILLIQERSEVRYNLKELIIVKDSLIKIMRIGIPSAISGMVFSISNLCVQSAINSLGTNTIAANTAALNIESFPIYVSNSFSQACITILSQNFGAEKFDRCKKIVNLCILLGMSICLVLSVLIKTFDFLVLSIFTNEQEVMDIAKIRINIVTIPTFIQVIYDTYGAALRALKHPYLQTVAVFFGIIVFRLLWIFFVFPFHRSFVTVCAVYPISWIILIIFLFFAYRKIAPQMLRNNSQNYKV